MPKSNFLRKKNKTGATADFKRLKAKVRPAVNDATPSPWPVTPLCHSRPKLVICHPVGIHVRFYRARVARGALVSTPLWLVVGRACGVCSLMGRTPTQPRVTFSKSQISLTKATVCISRNVRQHILVPARMMQHHPLS